MRDVTGLDALRVPSYALEMHPYLELESYHEMWQPFSRSGVHRSGANSFDRIRHTSVNLLGLLHFNEGL